MVGYENLFLKSHVLIAKGAAEGDPDVLNASETWTTYSEALVEEKATW